jgi:phosphoribosylformylglycinamidine synthase PurS subunit
MRASVIVRLKSGVLDPQGEAIANALRGLGHKGVRAVRVGKLIEIELDDGDAAAAKTELLRMADELLANPVMETFTVDVTTGVTKGDGSRA